MPLPQALVLGLLAITATEVVGTIKKKNEAYFTFFLASAIFSWILTFFYFLYDPNSIFTFGNSSISAEGLEVFSFILVVIFEVLGFFSIARTS